MMCGPPTAYSKLAACDQSRRNTQKTTTGKLQDCYNSTRLFIRQCVSLSVRQGLSLSVPQFVGPSVGQCVNVSISDRLSFGVSEKLKTEE